MDERQQAGGHGEEEKGKLVLIASRTFSSWPEMYRVVDFLNKNLKDKGVMFGLTKKEEEMILSVYEFS